MNKNSKIRLTSFTNISLRIADIELVDKYKNITKLATRTDTARYLIRLGTQLFEAQQDVLKKHLSLTN